MLKAFPLILTSIMLSVIFGGCGTSKPDLPVVKSVDLNRYVGRWYEIAKLPNSFEKNLTCITATYRLKSNGDIEVVNAGRKVDDRTTTKTATGTAWIPDPAAPTKLKVRFFWPFAGNYWILTLDQNYRFVMIGEPSRDYFWILAREKTLGQTIYDSLLKQADSLGFDTTKIEKTGQDCS